MLRSTLEQQKIQMSTQQKSEDVVEVMLKPGKYIMYKARNASECMINKKHGARGWAGGGVNSSSCV